MLEGLVFINQVLGCTTDIEDINELDAWFMSQSSKKMDSINEIWSKGEPYKRKIYFMQNMVILNVEKRSERQPNVLDFTISFNSPNDVMLFKLTFGGAL